MTAKRLSQIEKQIAKLQKEAENLRKNSIGKVVAQIRELMETHGISVEDLAAAPAGKRRGRPGKAQAEKKTPARKVEPKYRSPADASLTWTGRGKKPKWVQEWLDAGNALEALLIQ